MKKIIFTYTAILIAASIYGQELTQDTSKKEFKNIIGIDVTGLFRQVMPYYSYDYYPYYNYFYSTYIITYKRIFNKNAFRAGIGGNISNNNGTTNDSINSESKISNFNIGLGFEHYGYISKKWTFYYGMDIIGSYSGYGYQYQNSSNNTRKESTSIYRYGVSPLFGLMFRFNKRISIATETCYDITYNQTKHEYIYSDNSYNNSKYKSTGFATQYHAPTSLIIRIQF